MFALLYVGGWLTWWFLRAVSDGLTGRHPDIDDAWQAVRTQLDAAGIDLGRVPVFLVLGRPKSGVADFFAATALPFAVRQDAAPVGVFATREAVYLTAPVGWDGYDDGATPGRYRVRAFTFREPQSWPVNGHDVLRLRERAA